MTSELPALSLTTTVTERSFAREPKRQSIVLIHLGSPELGFANAGAMFPLDGVVEVRFGRAAEGDEFGSTRSDQLLEIRIPLGWASREHASLRVTEADRGGFFFQITDLESKNGTTVEDQRIHAPTRLQAGSVFEIGRSFWMMREVDGVPETRIVELDRSGTVNPALAESYRKLERLSRSTIPIVILGETGVGKDHVARAIHACSDRPGRLVHYDVAAKPVSPLLERRGAAPAGPLADAEGGTLFIDEIGELSAEGQAHLMALLGALGEGADVRTVAATTRDLSAMVSQGTFRGDLYSRIAAYELELPALRDRREDLGLLLRMLAQTDDGEPAVVTTNAFRSILRYRWPFNIRELRHALEAAVVLGEGGIDERGVASVIGRNRPDLELGPARIQLIREELIRQLTETGGDTAAVATALQCPEERVTAWLAKFQLDPGQYQAWLQ